MKRREAQRGPPKSRRGTGIRKGRKTSIARESIADLRVQLELRTRERDEALEQQAATAEVLKVVLVDVRPLRRFLCIASGRLLSPVQGCGRSLPIHDAIHASLIGLL
jgi:hypothetical protein